MTEPTGSEPLASVLDRPRLTDALRAASQLTEADVEQLLRATRVVLKKGDTERVLCAEQGAYLKVLDPQTERVTVRLFEGAPLGELMLAALGNYLERGYELTDWTLAEDTSDQETALLEALGRGEAEAALRAARQLLARHPDDARLTALGVAASVAARGPGASLTLSQRALALAEEPAWALLHHGTLLYEAGHRLQCLGVLSYLREHYAPAHLTAAVWELFARLFVLPLHRPGIAETLIAEGLTAHPDALGLTRLRARARLDGGDPAAALSTLAPELATTTPSANAFCLALQAHLEGGLEGTEALAERAVKTHPGHGLLDALALEVADRPGPALKAYRALLADAPSPAAVLELTLAAMTAALRVGAYDDALRLAREAQTAIGEPDPRCLAVMYDSLRALEPSEDREDLAEMVAVARREAEAATLERDTVLKAMLSAGLYLEPALLEPTWQELVPAADDADALRPEPPQLAEGLACAATGVGFVTLYDELGLAPHLAEAQPDWCADAEALAIHRDAGRLAVATGKGPVLWVRVTTHPLHPADESRFQRQATQPLLVPSGRVFVGPGEALRGGTAEPVSRTLGTELGGRSFYLAPGRYQVTVYQRSVEPWPADDVRTDPCDIVFHVQKG